jgi:hypothetical protein
MNGFSYPATGHNGGAASVCTHDYTRTVPMPEGSRHFAKLLCADCGIFLRFIPRPQNQRRWEANGYKLARLAMCERLNGWERRFVDDLAKRGSNKLSPKQQAVFDRLVATYLDGRAP